MSAGRPDEAIAFAGVAELGRLYRSGKLTPLAVVEAALTRLARLEPRLNAFADPMREAALADAAARTAELAAGTDLGPLHGIPVAIKDLIAVAGTPTGYGSKVRAPEIQATDAELVRRLRAAGAILLGKTNLLEYAYGIAHPEIGQTNNPHDPGRTSGGSSGGSAAAVAASIVPLAIGTDTGGSIRIPASYCGIVGLKPSYGLVPLDGVFPLSWSLDHAGPLARSIEDARLALACLAGDPTLAAPAPVALDGLRLGILTRHMKSPENTPGVAAAMTAALAALEAKGARLVPLDLPALEGINRALIHLLLPEAALIHEGLYSENPAGYAPGTRRRIEEGQRASGLDYVRAGRHRQALRAEVEAAFAGVDVLLSPSVPFAAPVEDPELAEGAEGEILASGFANMTGHPSLSLPAGLDGHLPVGLQLTGPLGQDGRLLAIAAALEAALPKPPRPAFAG
ncbi:amidase [Radicibacter daui]|uniref:amidase n=1 Tax=Radicibacter daui TaxID=3064829 RepID=UPI004046CC90